MKDQKFEIFIGEGEMRFFSVVVAAHIVLILLCSCHRHDTQTFSEDLQARLYPILSDSLLGPNASETLRYLREDHQDVMSTLGDAFSGSIDVILQTHGFDGSDGSWEMGAEAQASQATLENFLEYGGYQLVGCEGSSLHRITEASIRDSLRLHFIGDYPDTGIIADGLDSVLLKMKKANASVRFLCSHPEVYGFGYEVDAVAELHGDVYWILQHGGKGHNIFKLWRLAHKLKDLRSQIAIAQTMHMLHTLGLERGCLVIGKGHRQELERLRDEYDLPIKLIVAE